MRRILDSLKFEGEHALRASVWAFSGAALGASAAVFAAAALVSGLMTFMPLYGALACGAALLIALAAICFVFASRSPHPRKVRREPPAPIQSSLPEMAYRLLESEISAQPGKTAAAAVIAGLMLGALDALERNEKPHPPK